MAQSLVLVLRGRLPHIQATSAAAPHLGGVGGRRQDLAALEGLGIEHRDGGALGPPLRQGQQALGGAGCKGGGPGLGAARQQALHPCIRLVQHQGVAGGVDQAALVQVGQRGGGGGGSGGGAPAPPACEAGQGVRRYTRFVAMYGPQITRHSPGLERSGPRWEGGRCGRHVDWPRRALKRRVADGRDQGREMEQHRAAFITQPNAPPPAVPAAAPAAPTST